MRTTLAALVALALPLAAQAGPEDTVRNLRGAEVQLESSPAVLAFWSMDCVSCVDELETLSRSGLPVVAINTDSAQDRSRIPGWLRAHDLQLDVVADPSGRLQRRYQVFGGEGAVLTGVPQEARWTVASLEDIDAQLAQPGCDSGVSLASTCGPMDPVLAGIIRP